MASLRDRLLEHVSQPRYRPLPAKALARQLEVKASEAVAFRRLVKELLAEGRLELGRRRTILNPKPSGSVVGLFRKLPSGAGIVRPLQGERHAGQEIFIPPRAVGDAATGDEVLVRIDRTSLKRERGPRGEVVRIVERLTQQFVGTYFERGDDSFVVVDGTTFHEPIYVGDPGAKGARPDDKVVIEMIRFPTPSAWGEGVITEILGAKGEPGVDLLSIIRAYDLPDRFPPDVLEEARRQAAAFSEDDLTGRVDLRDELCITIDPPDAHDFDDALGLVFDEKKRHWVLSVHIADVAHFVPPGSLLDREAKNRGTSVYLPGRVLPMLPEVISNGLASLQAGRTRYAQTVRMELTAQGEPVHAEFLRTAIRVRQRFSYAQVTEHFADTSKRSAQPLAPELDTLLSNLRSLTLLRRERRQKRGALELDMPEIELDYDKDGQVTGGHVAARDISHQMVEECMLAANEAVAAHLNEKKIAFLRRNHDAPDPRKLEAFLGFVKALGFEVDLKRPADRFQLQRLLAESAGTPQRQAVHYALLRSLKQADYGPDDLGHYALASKQYCHFTSPIRRYPDLTIHRLLHQLQRNGRAGSDEDELVALGEHCSFTERRADRAEQDLVKVKLLTYLSTRIGMEMDAVVTGVEEYGFFCQGQMLPVEGLVHVATLTDDDYWFDGGTYSLTGRRTKRRVRLGDLVRVKVARVDMLKRQLDFRLVEAGAPQPAAARRPRKGKEKR